MKYVIIFLISLYLLAVFYWIMRFARDGKHNQDIMEREIDGYKRPKFPWLIVIITSIFSPILIIVHFFRKN